MSNDHVGKVFNGRYKVEEGLVDELLGRVYRGRDLERQAPVQIKVLHSHMAEDETRFARFLREVKATSMVRHENTIEMLDTGVQDGTHYVVLEDFPARSLEEELAEKGTLPIERVCQISAQIAAAIGAAHQESITHRALSPRNVLLLSNVRNGDFVKVRDFGLAKLERFQTDDEASNLTAAGVRVGNTAYMSPEYIENDRFHPKGDLYALGCLMTTMLTGEPPYTGRAAAVLGDHVTAPVPHPRDKREVPDWLDQLVVELLAKEPARRPGAYQVIQRLEEGMGRSLGPPKGNEPSIAPNLGPKNGPSISPMIVVAVLAGLLGIGGIVMFLVFGAGAMFVSMGTSNTASQQAPRPPPRPSIVDPMPQVPVAGVTGANGGQVEPEAAPAPPEPVEGVEKKQIEGESKVSITTNRKALVYLDGKPKGMTPIEFELDAGKHEVMVMLPSAPESKQRKDLLIEANHGYDVEFTF